MTGSVKFALKERLKIALVIKVVKHTMPPSPVQLDKRPEELLAQMQHAKPVLLATLRLLKGRKSASLIGPHAIKLLKQKLLLQVLQKIESVPTIWSMRRRLPVALSGKILKVFANSTPQSARRALN